MAQDTAQEMEITSSGSGENIDDYLDDSIVESLNKTETEIHESVSVSSSDPCKLTEGEELVPSNGKYQRSQSCASNLSNQSKGRPASLLPCKDVLFAAKNLLGSGQSGD